MAKRESKVRVQVMVDPEVVERIDVIATAAGASRSWTAGRLLQFALNAALDDDAMTVDSGVVNVLASMGGLEASKSSTGKRKGSKR